jgi:hypothetical protein
MFSSGRSRRDVPCARNALDLSSRHYAIVLGSLNIGFQLGRTWKIAFCFLPSGETAFRPAPHLCWSLPALVRGFSNQYTTKNGPEGNTVIHVRLYAHPGHIGVRRASGKGPPPKKKTILQRLASLSHAKQISPHFLLLRGGRSNRPLAPWPYDAGAMVGLRSCVPSQTGFFADSFHHVQVLHF